MSKCLLECKQIINFNFIYSYLKNFILALKYDISSRNLFFFLSHLEQGTPTSFSSDKNEKDAELPVLMDQLFGKCIIWTSLTYMHKSECS